MKFFRILSNKKTKIKMVHDEDLVRYLTSLGVYKDIINKKVKCKFCGNTINLENLQALFPCEDKICFVCSNTKCISRIQHDK